MEPVVSVVLPTHNRPDWLAESLTSVVEGVFQEYEVIVSNNGDPEHTRQLEQRIRDPRVRWVEQDRSLGMLGNFLAAVSLARGKYVALMHDDDRWVPHTLEALVPPMERNPAVVLTFSDHYVMDERGAVDPARSESITGGTRRADLHGGLHHPFFHLVAHHSVPATSCLFRREALDLTQFTPEVRTFYGAWMFYLLARTGRAAYFVPERLAYIRLRDETGNGSRDPADCLDAIFCLRRMRRDPGLQPYRNLLDQRLAAQHLWAGGAFLRQGRRGSARAHLAAAIRLNPTLKAFGGWTATWVAPKPLLSRI
jgi:glycosyltransferase involved in cell wall biosynthesis